MSDQLSDYDLERASYAETCSHCGARISQDRATPLRCLMCGADLHGQEAAWHKPVRTDGRGCPDCGRSFGPRGELLHWPNCPRVDADLELSVRAHPASTSKRQVPVPDEAEPRCPAHPSEPLFTCIECSDKRLKVRLP